MQRKILTFFVSAVLILSISVTAEADPIKIARYPNSSHGKIAFTYHGEIWLYEIATGDRRKLTDHESAKRSAIWSEDSRQFERTP